MRGRLLYVPPADMPDRCPFPDEALPDGTVWQCECGIVWRKTGVASVGWDAQLGNGWVPRDPNDHQTQMRRQTITAMPSWLWLPRWRPRTFKEKTQ